MAKNRIKELRNSANPKITLKELSDKLKEKGLSFTDSQLSYYENGIRSPRSKVADEFWQALSEIFNVDVSYLLGYSHDNLMPNTESELEERLNDPQLAQKYLEETGKELDDNIKNKILSQQLEGRRITKEFNKQFLKALPEIEAKYLNLTLNNWEDKGAAKLKYGLANLFTNNSCFLSDADIELIIQMASNMHKKNIGENLHGFFDSFDEDDYSLMTLALKEMDNEETKD